MAEKNSVQEQSSTTLKDRAKHWAIIGGVGLVAIFIVATVVPYQWGNLIANVVNRSWLAGIFTGVAIGFVSTFIPYWLLSTGWKKRESGSANIFLILGIIVALPNLITLWIVLRSNGTGNGSADRADQLLNLGAPGFKFGSLIGAIAAAALAIVIWNIQRQRDKAKQEAAEEHDRAEAAAKANETTRVVDHSTSSSTSTPSANSTANADSTTTSEPPTHP